MRAVFRVQSKVRITKLPLVHMLQDSTTMLHLFHTVHNFGKYFEIIVSQRYLFRRIFDYLYSIKIGDLWIR